MVRVALVTGASHGIGAAIAHALEARGDKVLRVSRHAGLAADVSTEEGRDRVVEAVQAEGRLDLLVNNVGMNVRRPTADYDAATWDLVVGTNARPPFELARRLLPMLQRGADPAVINLSSVAADRAVRTSSAAYAMSKGAVEAMTRFLAVEWGPLGVRVNAVAPWYVRTPLVASVLDDPEKRAAILARTPLGRVGEPEEVAQAVLFLADARWITGVVLPVDGGFSALGS
jgi:Tropinone reductase 1